MSRWRFLTNHTRTLALVAHDPDIRIRDIARVLGVTERSAHSIVAGV